MNKLQKLGGIAALYEGIAYIIGMAYFIGFVDSTGVVEPAQKVALLADNQIGMYSVTLIIYVIFGISLVLLSLALHERLKDSSPAMMQTATAFGLIWATVVIASGMIYNIGMETVIGLYATDPAQAGTVWLAINSVSDGIGGGVEVLGGIWSLLISWVALRSGLLPKALNYLGLLVGAAGIVTIVPAFGEIGGDIFGLVQIVWFIWLGIVMLRSQPDAVKTDIDTLIPQHSAVG